MRFVSLQDSEVSLLEKVRKMHQSYRVRDRAHALILSHKGKKIEEVAEIFEVSRDTVSEWYSRWESGGLPALQDAPGKGRKPKLQGVKKKSSKSSDRA